MELITTKHQRQERLDQDTIAIHSYTEVPPRYHHYLTLCLCEGRGNLGDLQEHLIPPPEEYLVTPDDCEGLKGEMIAVDITTAEIFYLEDMEIISQTYCRPKHQYWLELVLYDGRGLLRDMQEHLISFREGLE